MNSHKCPLVKPRTEWCKSAVGTKTEELDEKRKKIPAQKNGREFKEEEINYKIIHKKNP